jgi:hypothetical protein
MIAFRCFLSKSVADWLLSASTVVLQDQVPQGRSAL